MNLVFKGETRLQLWDIPRIVTIYLMDSTLSALQGFDFNIIQPVRWNVFVLQMDQFCSSFTIDMCSILRQELT